MWLAVLIMAVTFSLGLALGWSVSSAWAPYLGLAIILLIEGALRALRRNLAGVYSDRGLGYYLLSMGAIVLGLAWLGDQLGLGRVGSVPSLTLALEVALSLRILGYLDAIRDELTAAPRVPSPHETFGPAPGPAADGAMKAGKVA